MIEIIIIAFLIILIICVILLIPKTRENCNCGGFRKVLEEPTKQINLLV